MRFRTDPSQLMRVKRSPSPAVAFAAVLVACIAFPVVAADRPTNETQGDANEAAPATDVPSVGMRVAVDPATGRPRPLTAEESRALDAKAAQSLKTRQAGKAKSEAATAPRTFKVQGGGIGMELDESQMVYSVATVGPDGKAHMQCVTGADNADRAVHDHAHDDTNTGRTDNETK